jgi:hypothetical protein
VKGVKMKKLILTILIIAGIFTFTGFSQNDSTRTQSKEVKKTQTTEQIMKSFDKPGKKKDLFIDKDGDGICDNRAEGMSFQKMRKRKYHGGEGSKGGQGGNGGRGQGGNGGPGGGGK